MRRTTKFLGCQSPPRRRALDAASFGLLMVIAGCDGTSESDDPTPVSEPSSTSDEVHSADVMGPAPSGGGPSTTTPSTQRPSSEPAGPSVPSRIESTPVPSVDGTGFGPTPQSAGPSPSGEPLKDAGAPRQPPSPEVFPDVPDPVFEGPWFPCPQGDYPEHVVVVETHDAVVHTIDSTMIDAEVELPSGSFKAIALRVEHECPSGGVCDLYDRRAVVELVDPADPDGPNLGLMRYVTTYRFVEGQTNYMCSWTDVTQYAALLSGKRTIRSWLDTVVGPGHELGDGWQVSAELVFYPGPAPDPVQVEELYGKFIDIGAEPGSVDQQTQPIAVDIPSDATKVVAQLTISGHGWGPENTDNCAEFCRLDQTIRVNDAEPHVVNTFRDDCASNPLAPLQQRNPTGARNGWCPGAVVLAHDIDITDEVRPGMPATIDFGIQRPDGTEYLDADPTGYNPNELVSLQLLISRGAR